MCRWFDVMKTESEEMARDPETAAFFEKRLEAAGSSLKKERDVVANIIAPFPACHITWNSVPRDGAN